MAKSKAKTGRRIGAEIVERLKRFTDELEGAPDVRQQLTETRTVRSLRVRGPRDYTPAKVKRVRSTLRASQPLFAQFMGVSAAAVRDWEQGVSSPGGAARRLMDEIESNPQYFSTRLIELAEPTS